MSSVTDSEFVDGLIIIILYDEETRFVAGAIDMVA